MSDSILFEDEDEDEGFYYDTEDYESDVVLDEDELLGDDEEPKEDNADESKSADDFKTKTSPKDTQDEGKAGGEGTQQEQVHAQDVKPLLDTSEPKALPAADIAPLVDQAPASSADSGQGSVVRQAHVKVNVKQVMAAVSALPFYSSIFENLAQLAVKMYGAEAPDALATAAADVSASGSRLAEGNWSQATGE